ncbi:MAG: VOC family protein [Lewinellaceae bacterium]|nr:VOC family protein [Lewinellaceae bacterium]
MANSSDQDPKVTGIGGVFFKSQDPAKAKAWYEVHLGFATDAYGTMFSFLSTEPPHNKGYLQWSPFKADTTYFAPSTEPYMINYRVNNLEQLVTRLREQGVTILDEIATYDYGKFVHILDLENRKIELWEPIDETFDQSPE